METPNTAPPAPQASATKPTTIWEIYFPQRGNSHRDAIYIASFPEIVYFWPTIAVLFLCALVQGIGSTGSAAAGWLTIAVLAFNLLILVQDFDQKKFVIMILVLVTLLLGAWIINLYGFTFLQQIFNWIGSFNPVISTDAYLMLGVILSFLYGWGLLTPLFSHWRLEPNEFVHYTQPIGKDMSISRIGCSVYKEVPDVFEYLLGFGAGNLVIRKDDQILATIPHIPLLGIRMEAIEHMLSETRVVIEESH